MPEEVQSELLCALCLMPIMVTDYRLIISPLVTASDASLTGMALVRSVRLTNQGLMSLSELQSAQVSAQAEQLGLFEGQGEP